MYAELPLFYDWGGLPLPTVWLIQAHTAAAAAERPEGMPLGHPGWKGFQSAFFPSCFSAWPERERPTSPPSGVGAGSLPCNWVVGVPPLPVSWTGGRVQRQCQGSWLPDNWNLGRLRRLVGRGHLWLGCLTSFFFFFLREGIKFKLICYYIQPLPQWELPHIQAHLLEISDSPTHLKALILGSRSKLASCEMGEVFKEKYVNKTV